MHRPVKPVTLSVEPTVILHKTLYHDKRAIRVIGDRLNRPPAGANFP
jgi:hypothetical protein